MKFDPRQLAHLSMVVEAGSFQAAADRLGITQPALSRNLKLLEERIGAPLFQRQGRRSVPNALAARLAKNGLAIRLAEEQAGIVADRTQAGVVGELRVGAPPIVAGRFTTDALLDFMKDHPERSVELRTGLVHELRALLDRGQIDLIVGPQSLADHSDALEFLPLFDDRVGIMCRKGHALTKRRSIQAADLETQCWLAHSRGSLLRQQTEMALLASGLKRVNITFETDSIRSVLEIVANSDLITSMPQATTGPYLEDRLVFLPFDHPQFNRPIGIVQRVERLKNPAQALFIDALRKRVVSVSA